ncbi:magnesium transporter [Thiosocius teredinicola]|uniref:magnesium transporter n=1 Tax=Thiosocius teredinicola TaxID=1973002 RepID=UPI000990CE75
METVSDISINDYVSWVLADLDAGRVDELRAALAEMYPADIADLLEALPPEQRTALWNAVPPDLEGEILPYLHDEARAGIIDEMDDAELVAAAERMEVEDLAVVIEELPQDLSDTIIEALDRDHRERLEAVLAYDDGTAGRLMSTDVLSIRPDVSLAVVLRWLRRHASLPPHTDALMVTAGDGVYLGKLSLEAVVTGDPDAMVESVMEDAAEVVGVTASLHEVASLFDRRDLISVAVLDDQRQLLGRITIDDVVDIIREEADHVLLASAGLDEEEDLFAPIIPSAKRRGVWLGVNLITVFAAAWVIGQFEEALDKLVALAVLMPVVASMGGIAGSQTLTLTIRGMALDQIGSGNVRWLTLKELAVGGLNGTVWALIVALVSFLWFRDPGISAVIAVAMVLNLLAASLSGVGVPLILQRMGIDPALSGAVVLTTVTDVIGFLSFLGLASTFLL